MQGRIKVKLDMQFGWEDQKPFSSVDLVVKVLKIIVMARCYHSSMANPNVSIKRRNKMKSRSQNYVVSVKVVSRRHHKWIDDACRIGVSQTDPYTRVWIEIQSGGSKHDADSMAVGW